MKQIVILVFMITRITSIRALTEYNVTDDFPEHLQTLDSAGKYFVQLKEGTKIALDVTHHFNSGLLLHSFECSFRLNQSATTMDNFYLFKLIDKSLQKDMFIVFSSEKKEIIFYARSNLIVSKIVYPQVDIFDGKWHNIMYSISNANNIIKLWVDCEIRETSLGNTKTLLESSVDYDYPVYDYDDNSMVLSIGRLVDDSKQTYPIDISKMRFHGYSDMPLYAHCEDIEGSPRTHRSSGEKTFNSDTQDIDSIVSTEITPIKNRATKNNHTNLQIAQKKSNDDINRSNYVVITNFTTKDQSTNKSNNPNKPYQDDDKEIRDIPLIIAFIFFIFFIGLVFIFVKKYYY